MGSWPGDTWPLVVNMKPHTIILTYLTLLTSLSYAQTQSGVDSLLIALEDAKTSKTITIQAEAKKIISYGDKVLTFLANRFTDTTPTTIYSDCQDVTLTKGEIAIILADRIEQMPYYLLTTFKTAH